MIFRYTDGGGELHDERNFNGSLNSIAGICNERRNVVGLMPHPERSADPLLGGTDGLRLLNSVQSFLSLAI